MKTEQFLESLLEELANKPDEEGHYELVKDLYELLKEALDHEFHDFKNSKYPAPKMALVTKVELIANKAKLGKYDN